MKPFWFRFPYFLLRSVKKPSEAFRVIRNHGPAPDIVAVVVTGGASLLLAVFLGSLPAHQGGRFRTVVIADRLLETAVYYGGACIVACAFSVVAAPIAGYFTSKARLFRTILGSLLVVALAGGLGGWILAGLLIVEGGTLSYETQPLAVGLFVVLTVPLEVLSIMEIHELDLPKSLGIAVLAALPILLLSGLLVLFALPFLR